MRLRALIAIALLAVACGPKAAPKAKLPPPPPAPQLGEKCTPNQGTLGQGTCAAGLLCMPVGGGLCTSLCPCGGGATCAPGLTAPEMCLKSCQSDSDCKGAMTCNGDWKVCAPEGLVAGKPPACNEAAPARKSFGKVTPVSGLGRASYEPSALLDKEGNLVGVYVAGLPFGPNGLAFARLSGNSEVTVAEADKPLTIDRQNALDPYLARDSNGKLYLAYLGFQGGVPDKNMMVGLTSSADGASWAKPSVAHDAQTDCPADAPGCLDRPTIAVGPDRTNPKADVVYVFYWSGVTNGLRVTHSVDGGATFSQSAKVGDGSTADADVSSTGKLHVVYVGGAGNKMGDTANGVFYTSSSDGAATFIAPARISPEGQAVPYYFASPRVIVDVPRRLLYAVYVNGAADGKWQVVLATSKDGGVTWQNQTVNDDAPCATHMMPAAQLDPSNGKVHVIWAENRTGTGNIAYSACATGGEKCSKNELVNETPFAAFGFARQSSHTLGEYLSLVVDNKKKVLHAVWTQPVEEGGATLSRVFHSSAKLLK